MDCGLWINSLVFIIFAFSFSKPRTLRDWRSFSAFSAFIVALFVEMYGFPLTIYFLSGWLMRRYPGVDLFSHDAGHLWNTLLGWKVNPHSFRPAAYFEQYPYLRRLHPFIRGLESALRCAAHENARDDGPVCLRASSTVRWFHSHHAWLFAPMADIGHIDYVSDSRHDVCLARAARRTRSAFRVR